MTEKESLLENVQEKLDWQAMHVGCPKVVCGMCQYPDCKETCLGEQHSPEKCTHEFYFGADDE